MNEVLYEEIMCSAEDGLNVISAQPFAEVDIGSAVLCPHSHVPAWMPLSRANLQLMAKHMSTKMCNREI